MIFKEKLDSYINQLIILQTPTPWVANLLYTNFTKRSTQSEKVLIPHLTHTMKLALNENMKTS